ncbi:MAG: imidazole glycerol phosphate synthase subunit HisH [Bacteroidetes bacterium]|mgnify:FL=1|jgi:glutamine amidotransferase|nr:imidazole glycerol phosphate synthase subunit HisH [Bacteroidota bacterium]MBP7257111.1 imidazole glycerol phosphate synthase subunit HisH [Chitinophagales bacterium]
MHKEQKIVIIDYQVGNLSSIANMLKKVGQKSIISGDINEIKSADKLILPGVGSFDYGMNKLNESGITEVLNEKALNDKIPFLGICLGAQLLTQSSEEGVLAGLGWFKAKTIKFDFSNLQTKLKIPHMGWTEVQAPKPCPLMENLVDSRFYFVHSFHFTTPDESEIMLQSEFGYPFVSALWKENIYAVQFHPEKSHKFGMQLMRNFINL